MSLHAGPGSGVVCLSPECRPLRLELRPLVWMVLEEVAFDAEVEDGRLVARTSARQVAERLGVNPGTAAEALRMLGRRGLVSLEREKGPAGRFGLSAYQLRPPAGLLVVQPCTADPYLVSPSMVQPDTAEAGTVSPCVAAPHAKSRRLVAATPGRPGDPAVGADTRPPSVVSDPDGSGVTAADGSPRRLGRSASAGSPRHCPGQTALDLGLGSS